jgi:dihydrofolate reductase
MSLIRIYLRRSLYSKVSLMSGPTFSLVAAMDREQGIGRRGELPWHLPTDLRRFRSITMGKTIVMGRKTYQSIGRPLSGRRNIILSRDPSFRVAGCETFASYRCILESLTKEMEIMVIGGASIYSRFLPAADWLFLTHVNTVSGADVFFPEIDYSVWDQIETKDVPADKKNAYDCRFDVLKKRN